MDPIEPASREPLADFGNVAAVVRRQILQHVSQAATLVKDRGLPSQKFVHELRKEMKKTRAGLRLLSGALGAELTDPGKECRNIGRGLSALRDCDVVIELVLSMDVSSLGDSDQAVWRRFACELGQQREALLSDGVLGDKWRLVTVNRLDRVARCLNDVDTPDTGLSSFQRVVERSRDKGHKALRKVCSDPVDDNFHSLRKRAKCELYQRRLLADAAERSGHARIAQVDLICQGLGRHQDLVTLTCLAKKSGTFNETIEYWLNVLLKKCREQNMALARKTYFRDSS
ncbi:MAG: CHAD domain-containing protein [Gammaproteobacteria bacterium]